MSRLQQDDCQGAGDDVAKHMMSMANASCWSLEAVRVPFFPPAATFFPPTTALISGVPFFQTATATLFPGGDGLPAMIFRNKS
ncbi:hypothetical protein EJB05_03448, partial [Eragrostis curvula]